MKTITTIVLLTVTFNSFAQSNSVSSEKPIYGIHLTTMNENMLKGLLLEVRDSSVLIYPGKFKEWKKDIKYKPVEFGYPNIREMALKTKYRPWKKYYINGSLPLFNDCKKIIK